MTNELLKQPIDINNLTISNRLVAQAMEINSSGPDGAIGPDGFKRYKNLAEGGWGIVFVEAISVSSDYRAREKGLVISEKNLDSYKHLVEIFKKEAPTSRLLFQLTHSGRCSGEFSKKIKVYPNQNPDEKDEIPVATKNELESIQNAFLNAIALANQAGADGVDIKACHGYLGGEMLRPLNQRDDKYGGSVQNRARFLSTIIKKAVNHYPEMIIGTRLSLYEGIRGGCGTSHPNEVVEDLPDILNVIDYIVSAGTNYLNISAGIPTQTPEITRPLKGSFVPMYHHFRYTKMIKERYPGLAVIGSAYTLAQEKASLFAQENLEKDYVDLIGLGRQNLADPLYPKKLFTNPEPINYCQLCSGCSNLLKTQKRVKCIKYD